jgi:hypothetical protein
LREVAKRHGRFARVAGFFRGIATAEAGTPVAPTPREKVSMQSLPGMSGVECIEVLLRAGFRRTRTPSGMAALERGYRAVFIAETARLEPDALAVLLRIAGVSHGEFLAYRDQSSPQLELPSGLRFETG